MSQHWILPSTPTPSHRVLPLPQVAALLAHLGLGGRDAVAEDLLRLVDAHVPVAQCTIFAFEEGRKPQIVAIGDRSRTRDLPHIAQAYVTEFYRQDPLMEVIRKDGEAARQSRQKATDAAPYTVLQRQRPQDIAHPQYRHTCYTLPQVAERLAILTRLEGRRWFSVHFYRGLEHGPFDAESLSTMQAFAPLVVHAVRLHHASQTLDGGLADMLLARLVQRFALTQRDQDVVRSLMQGHSAEVMAERLGLTVASARTYQKRVYRKLGVGGSRELLGLLMEPAA